MSMETELGPMLLALGVALVLWLITDIIGKAIDRIIEKKDREKMSKPMIVYLAGPIRPKGEQTLRGNIALAKSIALELWAKGFNVFCPAANSDLPSEAAHDLNLPDHRWLNFDLEMLSHCDAMVIAPGWQESAGVAGEILYASEHDIPIYVYPDLPEVNQ